jgi:hypothetical protein
VPLSEEEQRILHEMEQNLYEHDRGFVERVRAPRSGTHRSVRLSVIIFIIGFVVVVLSFRQSLLLATVGFLLMLRSALAFERGARLARSAKSSDGETATPPVAGQSRMKNFADEFSLISKRLRSRFNR